MYVKSGKNKNVGIWYFKCITGTPSGWPYLLLINAGPALVSLFLLPFCAESPRYLMIIKKDRIAAERGAFSHFILDIFVQSLSLTNISNFD